MHAPCTVCLPLDLAAHACAGRPHCGAHVWCGAPTPCEGCPCSMSGVQPLGAAVSHPLCGVPAPLCGLPTLRVPPVCGPQPLFGVPAPCVTPVWVPTLLCTPCVWSPAPVWGPRTLCDPCVRHSLCTPCVGYPTLVYPMHGVPVPSIRCPLCGTPYPCVPHVGCLRIVPQCGVPPIWGAHHVWGAAKCVGCSRPAWGACVPKWSAHPLCTPCGLRTPV